MSLTEPQPPLSLPIIVVSALSHAETHSTDDRSRIVSDNRAWSLFPPVYSPYPGKEERLGGASIKIWKKCLRRSMERADRSGGGSGEIPRPLFNRHPPHDAPGNTSSPNLTHIFHRFARLSSSPSPLSLTFSAVTIPYGIEPRLDRSYPRKTPPFRGNVAFNDRSNPLLPEEKKPCFIPVLEKKNWFSRSFFFFRKKKKQQRLSLQPQPSIDSIKFLLNFKSPSSSRRVVNRSMDTEFWITIYEAARRRQY